MIFNKTSTLKFIDSLKLKGQLETNESIFNITKDSINVLTTTRIPVLAIKGHLKIENGEDIGEIGVGDIGLFRNFLSAIPSELVHVNKKKNKLVLTNPEQSVCISLGLINTEYIKNRITAEKFESTYKSASGNEFVLNTEALKAIIAYCSTIKADTIILNGEGKKLSLSLESNDNSMIAEFTIEKEVKPFVVKFNTAYLSAVLSGQEHVVVSLKENVISYFKSENDQYKIEYLLAPIKIEDKR